MREIYEYLYISELNFGDRPHTPVQTRESLSLRLSPGLHTRSLPARLPAEKTADIRRESRTGQRNIRKKAHPADGVCQISFFYRKYML